MDIEPLLATVLQECIENVRAAHASTGFPIMVIATTSDIDALPTSILGCFRHEVVVDVSIVDKYKVHLLIQVSLNRHLMKQHDFVYCKT